MTIGNISPPYKKSRLDGWPLCPQCGEDELYCVQWPATIDRIAGCYVCRWRPGMEPAKSINQEKMIAD